jgi:CHASE3 domain sensor protein
MPAIGRKISFVLGITIAIGLSILAVASYQMSQAIEKFIQTEQADYPLADEALELQICLLTMRRHEKDFIIGHDKAYVEESRAVLEKIQAAEDKGVAENARLYVDTLARLADNVFACEAELPVMRDAARGVEAAANEIEKIVDQAVADRRAGVLEAQQKTMITLLALGGIMLVAGIGLTMVSVRTITRPIRRIMASLSEGADQAASVASQSLAAGSSQQAAKNTAGLIEDTVKKEKAGSQTVGEASACVQAKEGLEGF